MNEPVTSSSHAKIILIGEHSVVYQQPAIALPLTQIQTAAELIPATSGQTLYSEYYTGNWHNLPASMRGIYTLIDRLSIHFNAIDDPWKLIISSDIPHERGMGSSAAAAVAITRAFFDYYSAPLTPAELLTWANIEETETHRNPSGIDAATVSATEPLWYQKGTNATTFPLNLSGTLVIADTGIKGATKEAIGAVKQRLQTDRQAHELIHHLGHLAHQAKAAITANHLTTLGAILNAAHHDLAQLNVSSPELDHLVHIARQAGALGAKLTGGGRGGCMLALANTTTEAQQIAAALRQAGAERTWLQPLKGATIHG